MARRRYGVAAALLVLIPVFLAGYERYFPDEADRIRNPTRTPLSMEEEGDGPKSPFFPSSSTTTSGDLIPSDFFMTSHTCQRCHPDIYEQWYSSMHHFSSFNNQWYRKSIEYMQDVVGTQPSKWCAGCHDHAVFFNGRFDTPIRGADRHPGSTGRSGLHLLPLRRRDHQQHGKRGAGYRVSPPA